MNTADLNAVKVLLARLGITPEQLLGTECTANRYMPTFREYISQVSSAVSPGTRRAYETYWRRIIDAWGDRRLDEPTPLEIKQLCEQLKDEAVVRKNSRGGRCATEHLISAFRWAVSIGHGDTMLRDQLLEDFDRLLPVERLT